MQKLVVLTFNGNLDEGIQATLAIGEEGKHPSVNRSGNLPTDTNLRDSYKNWSQSYHFFAGTRIQEVPRIQNVSIRQLMTKCQDNAQQLSKTFNNWLNCASFRPIKDKLLEQLNPIDEIQVIIRTPEPILRQLPWHLWDLWESFPKVEIALSGTDSQRKWGRHLAESGVGILPAKVRILVILGDSTGINVEKDKKKLKEYCYEAELVFLCEPSRQELSQHLWDKRGWDVLFFSGHSKTEGETGRIYLNKTDSFTINELKYSLRTAVENGLQLAFFNSCDGLGIATSLESLQIPQIIVMRQPVPDEVAQQFLKDFLAEFTTGTSFCQAVRIAREKLEGVQDRFPCASWLPIIVQNLLETPPTWLSLGAIPRCPYRGLAAFREEDKSFFYGREEFSRFLFDRVKNKSLVAIIGASGSGKSSVVFAGLVPLLRQGTRWQIIWFRPGNNPFESLAVSLLSDICRVGILPAFSQDDVTALEKTAGTAIPQDNVPAFPQRYHELNLENELRYDTKALQNYLETLIQSHHLVLIADQFEEIYTLCPSIKEREIFLDNLLNAVQNTPKFTLILTLRADFYSYALQYRPFADALQDRIVNLAPMNEEELKLAIEQPALQMSVQLEEGLTQLLIEKVLESPGRLPLLEFALTQLWERQHNGWLTHEGYYAIGGIEEAIANYAESVYADLNPTDRKLTEKIFIQLVQPGEGTEDTRRLASRDDVGENWDLVTRLADKRLVVTNCLTAFPTPLSKGGSRGDLSKGGSRGDQRHEGAEETVEIIHEALLRQWGRLQQWMKNNREFRVWQERIRSAREQWRVNQDNGALLRGKALVEAMEWLKKRPEEITAAERGYIERSSKYAKRQQIRAYLLAGLMTMLAVTAGVFGIVANQQRIEAQKQLTIIALRDKAAVAQSLLYTKSVDGLVLAIQLTGESQDKLGQVLPEVQYSLFQALEPEQCNVSNSNSQPKIRLVGLEVRPRLPEICALKILNKLLGTFKGHEDSVLSVAFSPDGQYIVSGGEDKTVRLWNVQGKLIDTFQGHIDKVWAVAFSPNGQYIASGSADGTIRLWDKQGKKLSTFKKHEGGLTSVAFSPNGQFIVSGSGDGGTILWDIKGNLLGIFKEDKVNKESVESVAFSPDGKYIVSGSLDSTIRLWNVKGNLLKTLKHEAKVQAVAFSPDGQYIASGSGDKTLRLWDIQGNQLKTLGHESNIVSVAFSPDGQYIVSGGADKTVRLWDRQGKLIGTYKGHEDYIWSVAFSPDGQYIISGSDDGTVRLWAGNWQSWLAMACNGLRDDSIFETEIAREAKATCSKYVWK